MLQRNEGKVPYPKDATTPIRKIAAELSGIRTFGGYVVDATGFGKTRLALLFLSLRNKLVEFSKPYRPAMIVAPSSVVLSQWVKTMELFPNLEYIVCYGERPIAPHLGNRWASPAAMRQAPNHMQLWPHAYKYAFDEKDPRAANLVILTTYPTFASRTLYSVVSKKKRKGKLAEDIWRSRWNGRIELVIYDEGHELRHVDTARFASQYHLKAQYHWFLTATPVQNNILVRSFRLV